MRVTGSWARLRNLTEMIRHLEIAESTWNRWRSASGGMKVTEANRLEDLEAENARLEKLVVEAELDKAMLEELAAVEKKRDVSRLRPPPFHGGGARPKAERRGQNPSTTKLAVVPHATAVSMASSRPVHVPPMRHSQDDDLMRLVVDPVENPIRPLPGTPDTFEFVSQRRTDPPRIVEKGSGDEVDHRPRHPLGQLRSDGSFRRGRDDDRVAPGGHRGRKSLTASSPLTTSPPR